MAYGEGQAELLEQAVVALRRAISIDPNFGNARNELGIMLSNLRHHAEAEKAFAAAEPFHGDHAHHWYARGNNYVALAEFGKAEAAFRRAMDLLGDGHDHLDAKQMLCAVLMQRGAEHEARVLGRQVALRTGMDPADHWQQVLRRWERSPFNREAA